MAELPEHRAVIAGIGQSPVARRLDGEPIDVAVDACLAAITDAGLRPEDIDGVSTYPGSPAPSPGYSGAGVYDIVDALRLHPIWYTGGLEIPAQLGAIVNACLAIAGGLATHVLCFRSIWEGSAQGALGRRALMAGAPEIDRGEALRVHPSGHWMLPYGIYGGPSPVTQIALMAARHFHEYGTTREQMAAIALNDRANAALNENAVYRTPLSLDDYLGARMISTPLCLYDCDVPADGCTAVVVSSIDRVADLRRPPLRIQAMGSALKGRPEWDQWEDLTTMAARDAAAMMWSRTDLRPGDVDVAQLYDGFGILAMYWLEAMGFCARGESGSYIEGGQRIARDGELPLNTSGGQLSGGRLHAFGLLHEACVQLWGEGGARQLPTPPEVAAVGAGGGPPASSFLLSRW